MWRFPETPVKLHCCSCQGQYKIDARNLQFPASNNALIETAGCQQRVVIYYPPDMQVNVNEFHHVNKDKRKKDSQSRAQDHLVGTRRFITVSQNKKCCCACQTIVESYKLDHGQEGPKNCIVM